MNRITQFPAGSQITRTYQDALALLDTRRRVYSKRWVAEERANIDKTTILKGSPSIDRMGEWVNQLGYSVDIDLNIIHVAGTKGKGSTCAFVNSFLQQHGNRTGSLARVGLYTSPPLITMRERIQIGAKPISEELFTSYTFELWEKLWSYASKSKDGLENMPRYRQFIMLLSLHVFVQEKVDVAIYETHSGGEYDCTNIVKPVATGITTIGMDHLRALGPTIENIAWHKAGIFKHQVPAFSMPQKPEVSSVFESRAVEKGTNLKFVDIDPDLPIESLILKPEVQKLNASLAIALSNAFLRQRTGSCLNRDDLIQGLEHFSWLGRFQHINQGINQWFLDTAHNELSLKVAAQWFGESALKLQQSMAAPSRVLVFSHRSDRDQKTLLQSIAEPLKSTNVKFDYVIFTTYEERRNGTTSIDFYDESQQKVTINLQNEQADIWQSISPGAKILIEPTVEDAIERAKSLADTTHGLQAFITGHDRLVGPALRILEPSII